MGVPTDPKVSKASLYFCGDIVTPTHDLFSVFFKLLKLGKDVNTQVVALIYNHETTRIILFLYPATLSNNLRMGRNY